jgi:hypothetical protein
MAQKREWLTIATKLQQIGPAKSHGASLLRSLATKALLLRLLKRRWRNISAAVFTFPGSGSNIQFTLVMSTP